MNEWIPVIVALIASIPGIMALMSQKKKLEAEKEVEEAQATEKIQAAALKMMDVYKQEFDSLKSRIRDLECRVKDLESALQLEIEEKKNIINGAWVLHDQVKQLNGTPYYVPPIKKEN